MGKDFGNSESGLDCLKLHIDLSMDYQATGCKADYSKRLDCLQKTSEFLVWFCLLGFCEHKPRK